MKAVFGTLLLVLFPFYFSKAQEVVKVDTLGSNPLSVSMDRSISEMMDSMEERCTTVNIARDEAPAAVRTTRPSVIRVPNRELTTAEICRQTPKLSGYKIQLTVVKSNAEANEVKAYFRRRFPNLKVEVDASLRPNYRILAGSYFTKQSAAGDLSRIRQYFKSALPVSYRIFCVEAR